MYHTSTENTIIKPHKTFETFLARGEYRSWKFGQWEYKKQVTDASRKTAVCSRSVAKFGEDRQNGSENPIFCRFLGTKFYPQILYRMTVAKQKRKTPNARDCSLMRWRFFWFVGIILLAEPKLHLWPVDWPSQRLRSSGWLSDLKPIIQNDNTGLLHTPQQKRPELFSQKAEPVRKK